MSMSRADSSSRRWLNPAAGYGRFVGRVGALAVALGLGAAIANSPGIALADEEPGAASGAPPSSTDSSASKDSSSDATGQTAAKTSAQSTADDDKSEVEPDHDVKKNDDNPVETTSHVPDAAAATDDEADTTPQIVQNKDAVAPSPVKRNDRPVLTSAPDDTTTTVVKRSVVPDQTPTTDEPDERSDGRMVRMRDDGGSSADPVDAAGPQSIQVSMRAGAVTEDVAVPVTAAAPPVTPPAGGPVGFVTGLVSGLLSAVGLNQQVSSGPVAPAEPPTLWALLGWVRREIGHAFNPGATVAAAPVATAMTALVEPAPLVAAAVSPLATQQQLAAEQIAARTAASIPVQLMKFVLRLGFMSSANQQFGGADQQNLDQLGAAVDEYAMASAFQQLILNSNDPTVVMQVAPPHSWYGQFVPGSRILYDNPDTIYRFMGVNAASSYVITGRFAGDVPADTTFSVLTGLTGNTASVLTKDQLKVNPDGTFTITADSSPANERDNHLQLPNDATLIASRNTLSDWTNQVPMSLSIQRVGGPPNSLFSQLGGFAIPGLGPLVVSNPLLTTLVSLIPPLPYNPPILRGVVTAVIMALGIQREATYMAVATTDPATGLPLGPNVLKNPTRNAEFLATQLQSAGWFQLSDTQALVIDIDPGDAEYFVVPVTNDWTISDNYWDEQTSLNNVQAVKNADGRTYTIVVSPTDPGVANWVSTSGLNQGTISIRFQDLPVNPTRLPTVSATVYERDALPADIKRISDADRALQLTARKAGFDNRFAPFPQL